MLRLTLNLPPRAVERPTVFIISMERSGQNTPTPKSLQVQVHSDEDRRRMVKNVICAFCAYFSPRCATCAFFATAQSNYYSSLFSHHPLLFHFLLLNLFSILTLLYVPCCVPRRAPRPFYVYFFLTRLPLSWCKSRDSFVRHQIENYLTVCLIS